MEVQLKDSKTNKYFKWPREMDHLLLDLLKEEKAKGNKEDKKFNKIAWNTVIVSLNSEFQKIGRTIDKTKAVNRLKTIQKLMYLAIELLDKKSGFGWNDMTKKIEAIPSVWDSVIQVKPDYKLIRDKKLYFLENARELFKKDRANGDGAESAKEKARRWQAQGNMSINDNVMDTCSSMNASSPTQDTNNVSSVARQSKEASRGIKRKKTDIITDEIMEVTASMKEIARAITNSSRRIYSAVEITTELKKLGLDKWETMEALDFLKDNEHLVERFFACDDEIKLTWLNMKMGK